MNLTELQFDRWLFIAGFVFGTAFGSVVSRLSFLIPPGKTNRKEKTDAK